MELKSLQYLESIYRHRSFTKAAEEHFISQPSVSNAVRNLEKELQVVLINRNDKPLTFTEAGERFMQHVYTILGDVDDAISDMHSDRDQSEQLLTIAWASTVGDIVRETICQDFPKRYPDIQIQWIESTHRRIFTMLREGLLDIAYTLIPDRWDPDLFEVIPVQICETCVVMSRECPLADEEKISLIDFDHKQILMFPPGALIRTRLEQTFRELHVTPDFKIASPLYIMEDMLRRNAGITLLPVDRVNSLGKSADLIAKPLKESVTFMKGFVRLRNAPCNEAADVLSRYVREFVHRSDNYFL